MSRAHSRAALQLNLDSQAADSTLCRMVYICAGMYRSGSTWLFNAARLCLTHANVPGLDSGWVTDKDRLLARENPIIKVHLFEPALAATGGIILTSHRDLRDVAASLRRKFNVASLSEKLREAVDHHAQWSRLAAFDLRYENLLADKMGQLRRVAGVLGLPPAAVAALPYETILQEIDVEKFSEKRQATEGYDKLNLLHAGHITDGRHGSWTNTLTPAEVAEIEKEFQPWLAAHGYLA